MDTPPTSPSRYNVSWDSPSKDQHGSMPLGNGDIGINAWLQPDGDLHVLVAKTDSWGDNGRLLKVGKIRLTCEPPLPTAGPYRQTLDLPTGTLTVEVPGLALQLWVDAHHPTIHMTVESDSDRTIITTIELWRTSPTTLPSLECSDSLQDCPDNIPTVVEPDTILCDLTDGIGWYHHNIKSVGPEQHARIQGLDGYPRRDPLLHRTFGAIVTTDQPQRRNDTQLASANGRSHHFSVHVLTVHPASPAEWLSEIGDLIAHSESTPFEQRRQAHQQWWHDFWQRSWLHITGADDAEIVSRGYALQRYITACAGRGAFPIKFNGSLFTVAHDDHPGEADYRRWGPGYWWQNTRLPYLSLCATGDFEMCEPLYRLYVDELLPLYHHRCQRYYDMEDAAFYSECITFWGDVFLQTYGWTPFEERTDPLQVSGYHKWEWVSGPELVWMMLDLYDHTLDAALLANRILPTARAVRRFFELLYETVDGQLVMHPSQALETWWDCTDPMPEIAGLRAITERLLQLPEGAIPAAERAAWHAFHGILPPLPTRRLDDGTTALAPASRYADKRNIENPELYAVFPFRQCAFEQANRNQGIAALRHAWERGHCGWSQEELFMAYLGLADEARASLADRAATWDSASRFPAFWGPNYDWTPDQDHGGVLMRATQVMLMQTHGNTIYLLPAWPRDWACTFKLHAPGNTIVQGRVADGKIHDLQVSPPSRQKDIVVVRG